MSDLPQVWLSNLKHCFAQREIEYLLQAKWYSNFVVRMGVDDVSCFVELDNLIAANALRHYLAGVSAQI